MPGGRALVEFLTASVLIILMPGPSVLFTVGRAIAFGKVAAVLTVFGNSVGALVLAIVVAAGIGPLVQQSQALLVIVQLAGAMYLVYLGVQAWRSRANTADVVVTESRSGQRATIVKEGFVVGVLNPKTAVFFATVMPRFLDPGVDSAAAQLLTMGCIFVVLAFISDSSYGLLAGHLRGLLNNRAEALSRLSAVGAVLICCLGIALAASTVVELAHGL